MIPVVEPLLMPTLERCFQGKGEEIMTLASLDTLATNDLALASAKLVFQEEIVLKERKVQRHSKIGFA
jgi:hypothetical protein